jgi:hypothetical protein
VVSSIFDDKVTVMSTVDMRRMILLACGEEDILVTRRSIHHGAKARLHVALHDLLKRKVVRQIFQNIGVNNKGGVSDLVEVLQGAPCHGHHAPFPILRCTFLSGDLCVGGGYPADGAREICCLGV